MAQKEAGNVMVLLFLALFFAKMELSKSKINNMYNWSVDEKQFKKADPKAYEIWKLEQAINYGEPGERLDEVLIKKNWKHLRDNIDPFYREFLELLLWPKKKLAF